MRKTINVSKFEEARFTVSEPATITTNRQALHVIMRMNHETPAQLAEVLGMTEDMLQKKLKASSLTSDEINMIKQHYNLSAEQAELIFFTEYELKSLKKKANAGIKRITAGRRAYNLKASDLFACWENVRHSYDFEALRILYYAGVETGFRLAMNQIKNEQKADA